ncbi:MAG: leucyl/phenylalanyl-tRNA--protein transferase [Spirochaetales bacterium]|nr:leucyl/phenylalanyl-tRNA--protein transferase [Spirochaetales bacterium]
MEDSERIDFPDPENANNDGILASGGNLSPGMLLSAYSQGVFPWYSKDDPILWWNPDPRCVLFPSHLHVSKRMERRLRTGRFILKSDTCFREVISSCAGIKRTQEDGTWINTEMIEAYCRLNELGYAHSIEVFHESELAGGLYGISLGRCFFGESMFSRTADASKAALIALSRASAGLGIEVIDCQIATPHLLSLGAEEITRNDYIRILEKNLQFPDLKGNWKLFD